MKIIAITTLGCKVNQFESAAFASTFEERGCRIVPFDSDADVYVINTCTVTAKAGQQSRQMIRRALRRRSEARVVVTGCYAEMDPEGVLNLDSTPVCVIGNTCKHLLVDTALADHQSDLVMLMGTIRDSKEICLLPVRRFKGRSRAYLRIQDGCDNFCSYCIVPYTRGRSRSLSLDKVLQQIEGFSQQGYLELVVTGINVGKYGLDLGGGETVYTLLERICRTFPTLRIRLSSIEPTEVNEHLLELMTTHANFMPHLHIPLQSGDDEVLVRMNRIYTRAQFAAVIEAVHRNLPSAAIGCDVLCGFPGESEQAAANTYDLLAGLPVSYLHVFPYSPRPGTLAAAFSDQVSGPVKTSRIQRLRQLDEQKRLHFYARHIGTIQQVLVERRHKKTSLLQGFSDNYIPLLFPGATRLVHQVVPVLIKDMDKGQPFGAIDEAFLEKNP
ncbi:tRNA (N(6)-L-threonylcarbamoyladenosine(37)-C(2))-methylthiotransferase MtaB [Desulfobulbus alkaliphilus]|uniref:tRNA (N(6)-L-threonylcarbamoyladenosine(37)-C(2))- methylthiotransferase MtaB n=1 Tax=Desulfobulbus alkaliphilus TaxID=869814 RepID=UPI0019653AC4|nr:tRNA (N(6)-L-threonylcarbamoyladenosine(37)-C(2))-methylthiotransferase MtaB [Desulfobulbus alkaliphilus]MBM9538330.1 tRNA (N(6)-L-threonylcarbamoyladenosine(37)-C(2))-methylthiotransferase MtaB [Desulfobulbus alkaliphilus]